MNAILSTASDLLGLTAAPENLGLVQVSLRSVIVFLYVLALLHVAKRRFMAQRNPLDILLAFLLASLISRGINGSAPFGTTLAAGLVLVLMHRLFGWLAVRSPGFARWLKGESVLLVRDGRPLDDALAEHHIARADLDEDLRLTAGTVDLGRVASARFERNGAISFELAPRVVDVEVAEGVQTIRIELR